MLHALTRLLGKIFSRRHKQKTAPAASPTSPQGQPPPASAQEVRKRLEGLGYIE